MSADPSTALACRRSPGAAAAAARATERTVLVLAPRFAPVNAPDVERMRTSLAYYPEHGWRPIVVCVEPGLAAAPLDTDAAACLPSWLEVHAVPALPARLTRIAGIGDLGLRALPWLHARGAALIAERGVDAVLTSTTAFTALAAAARWKRRFGTPFVVDLHDPWVPDAEASDRIVHRGAKHAAMRWLQRRLEAYTMPCADGLLSVTSGYLDAVCARYPALEAVPRVTLPFGVEPADIARAREGAAVWRCFEPGDGHVHGVYAGTINVVIRPIVGALCAALAAVRTRGEARGRALRLHFVGTGYGRGPPGDDAGEQRANGPAHGPATDCARAAGVADAVTEQVTRRPRREALRALADADFCIVLGSGDGAYLPSKAAECFATGRPVLCVARRGSALESMAREVGCQALVTFDGAAPASDVLGEALGALLAGRVRPVARARLEPYLAATGAREQCRLLDAVLA